MTLKMYQIDAFAEKVFEGNPAAVVPLSKWLPDKTMQLIAAENNLSETAFYIIENGGFHIRWFTPAVEVDLCGHATLASAYVIFQLEQYPSDTIHFKSRSGELIVDRKGDWLQMNFPTDSIERVEPPQHLAKAINTTVLECYKGKTDFMAILSSQKELENLEPDFRQIAQLPSRGLIVSAPGDEVDFVSRGFFPQAGVDEDPVTGSAHTSLTPYWSKRLNKTEMTARQISKRGGTVKCTYLGDRVLLAGKAVAYLQGVITI